jgi:hypothetical protein
MQNSNYPSAGRGEASRHPLAGKCLWDIALWNKAIAMREQHAFKSFYSSPSGLYA